MNKKKLKKLVPAIAACGLVGAMFAGGAMAYLTDTDTTTNTFTVGEVTIETQEPNYPGNGSDETKDLVPMEEVKKDPQITNSGKNRAIVYTRVQIPMANVITAAEDGTRENNGNAHNVELFDYRTETGAYDSTHEEWVEIDTAYVDANGKTVGADQAVAVQRLYGYKTVVEENETTVPVFDVVRMANVIEEQIDNSTQNIVITSYAIQAENISGITDATFDDVMDEATLDKIYQVYMNQSSGVQPGDADTDGDQTIIGTTLNVTMTLPDTHLELNSGDPANATTTAQVKVAYTGPQDASVLEDYYFTSSAPDVASIDTAGKVTAKAVGQTVITVFQKNPDTGKIMEASVTVTVRDRNFGETTIKAATAQGRYMGDAADVAVPVE